MFEKSYKSAALMRRSGSLAAALLAGAVLAGCQSISTTDVTLTDQDYRKRHPILIAEQPEVMDIPVALKATERMTGYLPPARNEARSPETAVKVGSASIRIMLVSSSALRVAPKVPLLPS